jgi:signal transduction histidine kinase
MKIFSKATLKLTAMYTAVLFLISISFSFVIAFTTNHEIKRPIDGPPHSFVVVKTDETVQRLFRERAKVVDGRITAALVLVNVAVLLLGATGSYFLARLTLRPIERAMAEQARFVSDASHELRTPLAAMAMENEVALRDKKLGRKDLRDQLASNLEEVDKLRALTDYLLQLNQDEPITTSNIDAVPIITAAIDRVKKSAAARQIIIKNQAETLTMNTNVTSLTEILAIVLDNAIKYSPAKSRIEIATKNRQIIVRDHGAGIATADLPHIFDRFYRAEKSRTSEGYGLGLALARHLAEKSNLKITATNHRTGGAEFHIS